MELNTEHPLYGNLKFLFCVDEGDEMVDLVTPSREFTRHENTVVGSGALGRHLGVRRSGTTAYLAEFTPSFKPANNTGTLVVVTNRVGSVSNEGLYCQFIGGSAGDSRFLPRISASGGGVRLYCLNGSSGSVQSSSVSTTSLVGDVARMWTGVRDGTTAHRLYVDDVEEVSGEQIGTNSTLGFWTTIGGLVGNATMDADIVWIAWFDVPLTAGQVEDLYDSLGPGNQFALVTSSGSTPVAFSGTIPTQSATEGTPFSVDLSGYFSGTETPFVYSVQSGTLPDGLDLDTDTGEITGTPTTAGTSSGIVIRATDGNSDTADSNSFSVVVAAADTTAPVLTSPTGTATGQTTASGTVETDEANGTLYWLATTNSTESAATVKGGSSQAVTATGEQSVGVTGLTAATGYYLHYVHRDAAGNDSTVASSSLFTTDSVPVAVPGVRIQLHDGATEQASLSGLTVAWFDDDDPATFGAPVLQSAAETTDASGWLEVDLDGYTALDIDDPGFLIVYKAGATAADDIVFAGRLTIEDIG